MKNKKVKMVLAWAILLISSFLFWSTVIYLIFLFRSRLVSNASFCLRVVGGIVLVFLLTRLNIWVFRALLKTDRETWKDVSVDFINELTIREIVVTSQLVGLLLFYLAVAVLFPQQILFKKIALLFIIIMFPLYLGWRLAISVINIVRVFKKKG
jgi:hypothetical protein